MHLPFTIPDMITASRDLDSDSIALQDGTGSVQITYRDLVADSDSRSRSLCHFVSAGERIAVMMEGGVDLSLWILAIMWRHTVVPLRPDLSPDDIRRYLTITQARCLVTAHTSVELERLCADIGVDLLTPDRITTREPLLAEQVSSPTPDSIVVVLLTSGSTGTPKVVPLRHRNMATSTRDMARALHLTSADRCLVQWSQYHIGGLIDHLLVPLSTGGTIINGGSFSLEVMKQLIRSAQPTWTQFVPATLDETIRDSERTSTPLVPNTLRFIRCVAAPMNEELWDRAELAFGCPVLHAYGMTEASPLVTATPLGAGVRTRGSTGRSVGPEIRIVDEKNTPVGTGIEGEIQIRGANVFDGYEGDPQLNAATFVDGWFRTGDLGYLDDDGELFVRGRAKNMINRGGEKINPAEVEEVLRGHPDVTDAAVFGIPHRRLGHVVGAAVSTARRVEPDEIVDFAARTLSPHKIPALVLVLDDLPRLGVGKVDLNRLVDLAHARTSPRSTAYRNSTEQLIAAIWADELGTSDLPVDVSFTVVGGDSLSATRVVAEIERVFSVRGFSDRLLASRTIRDMTLTIEALVDQGRAVLPTSTEWKATATRWNNSLEVADFAQRIRQVVHSLEREVVEQLALTHLCADELDDLIDALERESLDLSDTCPTLLAQRPTRTGADASTSSREREWSRSSPHEYVSVYARTDSPASSSTLLAFAGNAFRIMMPIHRLLAHLPTSIGSVVLIVDPHRNFFESGIPGIAADVSSLAQGLRALCPAEFDRDIRTLGASAGGLAAAVVGMEVAARSIALVGSDSPRRHPTIERIMAHLAASRTGTFDCRAVSGIKRGDLEGLWAVRRTIPRTKIRVYPTRDHNVFNAAGKRGRLTDLIEWLIPG